MKKTYELMAEVKALLERETAYAKKLGNQFMSTRDRLEATLVRMDRCKKALNTLGDIEGTIKSLKCNIEKCYAERHMGRHEELVIVKGMTMQTEDCFISGLLFGLIPKKWYDPEIRIMHQERGMTAARTPTLWIYFDTKRSNAYIRYGATLSDFQTDLWDIQRVKFEKSFPELMGKDWKLMLEKVEEYLLDTPDLTLS